MGELPPPLPPAPAAETLRVQGKTPLVDVGVLLGVNGVGQDRLFQGVEFALSVQAESLWLRRRDRDVGLGLALNLGTSGFFESRASLGPLFVVPLVDPILLGVSVRALGAHDGHAPAAGLVGALDVGLRTVHLQGHYSHVHALTFGFERIFVEADGWTRPNTIVTIAVRVDAFWFVAPFLAL